LIIKFGIIDKINGLFFYRFLINILFLLYLFCQIKTETSSAGEQLARDIVDARQKYQSMVIKLSIYIFREPYAFKNSSINFVFLFNESPL